MTENPETVNDTNRYQLAALVGWTERANGWTTPAGVFYCRHAQWRCLHAANRDAELARGLAKLREAREKEAR